MGKLLNIIIHIYIDFLHKSQECIMHHDSRLIFYHQSRRYKGLKEGELPTCESLKDTIARALPFWNEVIVPEIKAGKNVLIAAHGNSLRGIVKHLEGEFHTISP